MASGISARYGDAARCSARTRWRGCAQQLTPLSSAERAEDGVRRLAPVPALRAGFRADTERRRTRRVGLAIARGETSQSVCPFGACHPVLRSKSSVGATDTEKKKVGTRNARPSNASIEASCKEHTCLRKVERSYSVSP